MIDWKRMRRALLMVVGMLLGLIGTVVVACAYPVFFFSAVVVCLIGVFVYLVYIELEGD